ncbi:MAG: ethanolamine utilization protein EutP [Clostridia bacterium]|nr:ethanolamine utilization protein EutP [Clostridia bacterium]
MRKLILVGRSESGKTTLTQVLKGGKPKYHKTQYINYHDVIIDTPGEYAENKELARALALYSYEADVVGLLLSATEQYSLYSPCCTAQANREVVGIVTKIDHEDATPERAEAWLRLAGCERVFLVSSYTGEGIDELLSYLEEDEKQQKNTKTQKKSQKVID